MYETIKNNILNNFLIPNYLWTCIVRKESLFEDMTDRCAFPFEYDYNKDILNINLGDNINISFNFTWKDSPLGVSMRHRLVKIY